MPDEHTGNTDPANKPNEPAGQPSTPPWGDNFDPERAWRLIENLRGDNAKAKERLTAFEKAQQERDDAEKSEIQKANERAERAEKALAERDAVNERNKALSDALKAHGLDADAAELLEDVPTDKLDARAKALAARLGKSTQDTEEPIPGKPKAKLTPGHQSAAAAPGNDPRAIAQQILSNR